LFFDTFCLYLDRMYDNDPERYPEFEGILCEGGIGPLDAWNSDIDEA